MRCLFLLFLAVPWSLAAREFTVVVYNVENLFDVDGVAEFSDYRQSESETPEPYTPRHLLTKLRHITETLKLINDGAGPEIVVFQEIELDRTPFSDGGPSPEAFLEAYKHTTVEAMLTAGISHQIAGLPAERLLLKHLADEGVGPYFVVKPEARLSDSPSAQNNVTFSRFPIRWVRQRPMASARDLLVVGIDVDGHELIVMNNHWKSGASNAATEPIRVQNAHVVRAEVLAILRANPAADVIVAGDLNSYYNQKSLFPELAKTGINDVLRSTGAEQEWVGEPSDALYNLWYELPPDQRGSEVWRGHWGTLMQILLTRGLYDEAGVQYVDNSFFRLILPGRNVDSRFGIPRAWVQMGEGAGFSDHLPIGARFRVAGNNARRFQTVAAPSFEEPSPSAPLPVDYTLRDREGIPSATILRDLSDTDLGRSFGDVFNVEGTLTGTANRTIRIGEVDYGLYIPSQELREQVAALPTGSLFRAYGQLVTFRGAIQFVIQRPDWMLPDD